MTRRGCIFATVSVMVLGAVTACTTEGPSTSSSSTSGSWAFLTQTRASSSAVSASAPSAVSTSAGLTSPSAGPPTKVAYGSSVAPVDSALAARMASSWQPGCPVALGQLRYLQLTYLGMDGGSHVGELVVHADVAGSVSRIFGVLYGAGYRIAGMRLVDDFGGSDNASMDADNTSAFNCRQKTDGGGWSNHSYGKAIDLNPVENPYVSGSSVLPPSGSAYVDRPAKAGVIHSGDAVVAAFQSEGWTWGGYWTSPIDFQHFEHT